MLLTFRCFMPEKFSKRLESSDSNLFALYKLTCFSNVSNRSLVTDVILIPINLMNYNLVCLCFPIRTGRH